MVSYDRSPPSEYVVVDEWDGGFSWVAHPEEVGHRTSHALLGDDGDVWLVDPLDAPGLDDRLAALGAVAGVVVCSDYHTRDAATLARRHGVAVHLPRWLSRARERLDAPVTTVTDTVGRAGFEMRRCVPFPGWTEALLVRERDGTLYVPDVLGTTRLFTVGPERVGSYLLCRPRFPKRAFAGLAPDRLLVGHGEGVFEDATAALDTALTGTRRRLPAALATGGVTQLRALAAALLTG
jgi:hypothetical protein